jgi:hypothetical protein
LYSASVSETNQCGPEPPPGHEEWWRDFEAAARRPLTLRLRYAFVHTYKPVLDDASFRAFDSMAAYRAWCERNLPDWLGYQAAEPNG